MKTFQVLLFVALSTCIAGAGADPQAPDPPIKPEPIPDVLPHACGQPVEATLPVYPIKALRKAQTGWVVVEFDVTRDGAVTGAKAVESSPPGLFEDSSVEAVGNTRFPASNEERTGCRQLIEFNIGRWDK